jgi:S1-C subfamily serine protease
VLDRRLARFHEIDQRAAVEILSVSKRSPAAAAGLAEGDLLLRFDQRQISTIDSLQALLRDWPPGKPAPLDLLRRGKVITATVVPTEHE